MAPTLHLLGCLLLLGAAGLGYFAIASNAVSILYVFIAISLANSGVWLIGAGFALHRMANIDLILREISNRMDED
jgi:hypothetical protein